MIQFWLVDIFAILKKEMSILNASAALRMNFMSPPLLPPSPTFSKIHTETWATIRITTTRRVLVISPSFAMKNERIDKVEEGEEIEEEMEESRETLLYSFTALPLFFMAALPGAGAVRSLFCPFVELIKSWNLLGWLVHWGHLGNMAVVLFAMGGCGTYLGFCLLFLMMWRRRLWPKTCTQSF